MTGLDHETTEAVTMAAMWIIGHRHEMPRPIIPHIRRMFGLSPAQACEAIAEANRRRDHGGS
ncbi:MAG: hypothetical protein MEQ84_08515 [Mesorhizobium sp.]|nr:hypothetical protein [Mesorhizobium sp.]